MKTAILSIEEIASNLNQEFKNIEKKITLKKDAQWIEQEIESIISKFLQRLQIIEETFTNSDKRILKSVRTDFHQRTNHFFSKSYFLNRARTWPQGHQGDYKTLEVIYRNTPLSSGIGYYLDLYGIRTPLAFAVRNRIKVLETLLKNEIIKREKPKLLNIACGSCRELVEISPEICKSKAQITCVDDDSDALNFALNRLSHTESIDNINFLKYNALRMFDYESNLREFGMQDIIYSVGLFDYLPDDFLIKLIEALYALLNPNGKLILAFKDASYYDPKPYHWIGDWDGFEQRIESDFERILINAQIPYQYITNLTDDTQIINFYVVTKN